MRSVKDIENDKTQHNIYVPNWLWDAAGNLPIGRQQILTEALLNAISSYQSDIPKLKYEIEKIDEAILKMQSEKAIKQNAIAEFELKEVKKKEENTKSVDMIQKTIEETINTLSLGKMLINNYHYKRLEKISGTPAEDIKQFFESKKFRPEEDELRMFYMR